MVQQDGGDASTVIFHPLESHAYAESDTMGADSWLHTPREGRSDSTRIFAAWEGVIASRAGRELHCFALEDYDIPYGYSLLLLAHPDVLSGEHADAAGLPRRDRGGIPKGIRSQGGGGGAVRGGHPSLIDRAFVEQSAALLADKFLTSGRGALWAWALDAFVNFLSRSGILINVLTNRLRKH